MVEDKALQLYFEKHYPIRHGFPVEVKQQIIEADRQSIGFKIFCSALEAREIKDSIRLSLPKWLKWLI